MVSEADLMKECCGFFELPFSKQLELNEAMLKEHLQRWAQTDQAKALCPKGFESIEAIPVTTYDDYPAMLQLKFNIERLEKTSPRVTGELLWDYYDRIGKAAAKPILGYVIGNFLFVAKTTGTVGDPKWVVHGNYFWENFRRDVIATTLLACSDYWGRTKFKIGDKGLNFTPSAPFLSGWGRKASQGIVLDVPPVSVMDEIIDTRRRFFVALEYLEKGNTVNLIGGIAPSVYLMCEYLSNPENLFKSYSDSVGLGLSKLYLLQKWIRAKASTRSREVRDFLKLKGLMIGGVDTSLYYDYLKTKLGIEPFAIYGVTEVGIPMFGHPENKRSLFPNLRSCHFEFFDEKGQKYEIDELKLGSVYNLAITAFGGIFVRYKVGDLVRVSALRDDGMPVFMFWGRVNDVIRLRQHHFRITEAFIVEAMARAGLTLSDRWAVTKTLNGDEKLLFLMENTWGLSEDEVAKRIYDAMYVLSKDFRDFVSEYKVNYPKEIIKIVFLSKGTFLRYTMKKAKEGYPVGQIKPPKIISPERQEICDLLQRL
jgi:hypothetical protein